MDAVVVPFFGVSATDLRTQHLRMNMRCRGMPLTQYRGHQRVPDDAPVLWDYSGELNRVAPKRGSFFLGGGRRKGRAGLYLSGDS